MKHEPVKPLNYCAHAIESMREQEPILRDVAPLSALTYQRIIEMLERSVKFILPNRCQLIDLEDLRQAHLDLLRLPFPCIALEASWEGDVDIEEIGGFQQTPATKRIALCWEPRLEHEVLPGLNDALIAYPGGGVFVVPIYWGREYRQWTMALGGAFLPYDNVVRKASRDDARPISRITQRALIEVGLAKERANEFLAEPFYLLPEFFKTAIAAYGSEEKAYAQIALDCRDEAMMLIQACTVINCVNVTSADIEAPAALNKKREAKGKQPLFSYKVLQLSNEARAPSANEPSGHHASPRTHLRRGHLRRLESKMIWVRPTMVNADSKRGIVMKDYAVRPRGSP